MYGLPDSFGPADGLGPSDSNGQYGPAGVRRPAELGPGQDPDSTSAYPWPGDHGPAAPDPGSGPASRPDPDTGSHTGWAFRPEAAPYGSGALGDQDSGSFPDPDTGAFGRAESGTFARPDTGSLGRSESGAFPRAVPDSYQDSGTFRRLDRGSFGADDEDEAAGQSDSNTHDSGTIRWMSGPPPAKPRTERSQQDLPERGDLPGDRDGYADWHDDPADDEWHDDADGGLLSRRFGRGGGGGDDSGGGGSRTRTRGRKRRRFRGKAALTVAVFVVILVVGIAAAAGYSFVNRWINNRYGDYAGAGTGQVEVTVPETATLSGLGPMLVQQGCHHVGAALRHRCRRCHPAPSSPASTGCTAT